MRRRARPAEAFVQAERPDRRFSGQPLFCDVSFTVHRGDRIGLVGVNGCGKTSLLRVMLGELMPSAGRVWFSPSARIGYFGGEGEGSASSNPF